MKTAPKPKNNQNNEQINQKRKNRVKKIAITLTICFVVVPIGVFLLFVGGYAIWAQTVSVDETLLPTQKSVPTLYYADGSEIEYNQNDYISPKNIPQNLKNAFVAMEDKRFYKHKGYDVVRMVGATINNLKEGAMREGASTITQQLVKNTHLSSERTLSRKLKEVAIASKLEKKYSKDEIMSMYLSVIYFGSGAYGVKQASRLYFDKGVETLTLSECATLAGIVKNPRDYSPLNNKNIAIERRNLTLKLMCEQNLITEHQMQNATNEDLKIAKKQSNKGAFVSNDLSFDDCKLYVDKVVDEVCDKLNITKYQLGNSGLKIYTNLDKQLQIELKNQAYNKQNFSNDEVLCASVIVNSISGDVLAYHSPLSYEVKRQAGSTLKPLAVYAPAIDMEMVSLATPVVDEKIDFGGYSPNNYGGKYYGDTNVKQAISKSMNSVAVTTMNYVGIENSVSYLSKFGISTTDDDKNYALSLGAIKNGVSPLEMASAYSVFARGGTYNPPSFVKYVVKDGVKTDFQNKTNHQAVRPSTASLMSVALKDTVKNGTAKGLDFLPFEIASKTGTSERENSKNSDAWSVSYNNDYTIVVWHGNDESLQEKGGSYPTRHSANVWQNVSAVKNLSRTIGLSKDVVEMEIDCYSTTHNKQVTLSSQNTPIEYRNKEYFAISNLPNCVDSKFDNLTVNRLEVSTANGVEISFEIEKIYNYTLYRTDALGEQVVTNVLGEKMAQNVDASKKFCICDNPISLGAPIKYRLRVELAHDKDVYADEEIEVYIKNEFDFSNSF